MFPRIHELFGHGASQAAGADIEATVLALRSAGVAVTQENLSAALELWKQKKAQPYKTYKKQFKLLLLVRKPKRRWMLNTENAKKIWTRKKLILKKWDKI